MQTQNWMIYLLLFIIIVIIIILLILKKEGNEGYQPSQPSRPSYIGDEVWWYQIFPQFSMQDLSNFAETNVYNRGLVQRLLEKLNLSNFNEAQLENAIFFKGTNLTDLVNIFNTIAPDSAHLIIIRGEEYVLLDQTFMTYNVNLFYGYRDLPIHESQVIFLRLLPEEEAEGEKNILESIIYFKWGKNSGKAPLFFDALDNLKLEREFDKEQYYYRPDNTAGWGHYYIISNDYQKKIVFSDDGVEKYEVIDFNAAKENGQLIRVYTPENILYEILKPKGKNQEEIEI